MNLTPEQKARVDIDAALEAAGWILQNRDAINLAAGPGVAVHEAKMASGHGFADYLLFVNGKAVGAIEAKPAGLNPPVTPLPFVHEHGRGDPLHQRPRPRPQDPRDFRQPAPHPSAGNSGRMDRGGNA